MWNTSAHELLEERNAILCSVRRNCNKNLIFRILSSHQQHHLALKLPSKSRDTKEWFNIVIYGFINVERCEVLVVEEFAK